MIKKFITLFVLLATLLPTLAYSQSHVDQLDSVRNSIITQGNLIPDLIKNAKNYMDLRTLERIYELNTSVLVTIEAYFRMLKVVVSSEKEVTKEVITSLNDWLNFMDKQCSYDLEYLNSAETEIKNIEVLKAITTAKTNLTQLSEATKNGIEENNNTLK